MYSVIVATSSVDECWNAHPELARPHYNLNLEAFKLFKAVLKTWIRASNFLSAS